MDTAITWEVTWAASAEEQGTAQPFPSAQQQEARSAFDAKVAELAADPAVTTGWARLKRLATTETPEANVADWRKG